MRRTIGGKKFIIVGSALAVALALPHHGIAGVAPVFDLTGTWTGKVTCTFQDNGVSEKVPFPSTMTISQNGNAINVLVDSGSAGSFAYGGWAQVNAKKSNKGATTFVECQTNPFVNNYNEVVSAIVTIKPTKKNSANAVLTGTSGYSQTDVGGNPILGGICKYKFTRTIATDPGATGCSPI